MKLPRRKKRPPRGIEADLDTKPGAREWLHSALPTSRTYAQISVELAQRFGITNAQARLSPYYRRHSAEIMAGLSVTSARAVNEGCNGFEITVAAPGAERITVQARPLTIASEPLSEKGARA